MASREVTMAFGLVKVTMDWLDQQGPFFLDTQMQRHNHLTEEEEEGLTARGLTDVFKCGKEGHIVTKGDIHEFIKKVISYMDDEVFNNGRSYFFGGIRKCSKPTNRSPELENVQIEDDENGYNFRRDWERTHWLSWGS
jgi:hypothetical protein